MQKDSILMHYLDSLVSADAKDKLKEDTMVDGRFFVVEQSYSLNETLQRKIDVIKKIQNIRKADPKVAASFFAPFANNSWSLNFLYKAVLQSYRNNIVNDKQEADPKVLLEIADKMILAALLQAAVFRGSSRYFDELVILEQLLFDLSCKWSTEPFKKIEKFDSKLEIDNYNIAKANPYLAKYNQIHTDLNFFRFFLMRLWRWLVQHVTRALAYCKELMIGIQAMRDNGVGVFLGYFTWIFFIPRILINLCTIAYSILGTLSIFGSKQLPKIEKEYGWYLRLKMRNDIFFEMSNDWLWFSAGLINCFSLAGGLPIIGIYIMVIAQVYDFSAIMFRNHLDGKALGKLQSDLKKVQSDNGLSDDTKLLSNTNSRVKTEKEQLLYAIFNFAVLLMCIALMTPAFGNISPYIPLVASLITVMLAPLRGFAVYNYRKKTTNVKPLISKESYGVIVLDSEDKVKNPNVLGYHSQGLIGIWDANRNEITKIYKYDKNQKESENKLVEINLGDKNILGDNLSLYSRVRTEDKEFIKKFGVEFQSSNDQSIGYGITSFSRIFSSP